VQFGICATNQIFSPKDLNKKLADAILGSAKECETLLKSYDMSEVLQISVDGGLLDNIRDKKEIKKLFPHALPMQKKGAEYKDSKREGRYSFYRITDDLERFNRVISNPKAIALIDNKLKKYGLLQKFYEFMALTFLYAVMEGDVPFNQLLRIAEADFNVNPAIWKQFKEHILALKEEELQDFAKEMVACELEDQKCLSRLLVLCRWPTSYLTDMGHTSVGTK
jgi:hypothetical protein